MAPSFNFKSSSIGFTIEPAGARYVEMNRRDKTIVRTGFLPFESNWMTEEQILDPDGILSVMKLWIEEEKLTGKNVQLSIPTSQAFVRRVKIPKGPQSRVKTLIDLEIHHTMQLPFEDPVYDYVILTHADAAGAEDSEDPDRELSAKDLLNVLIVAAPRLLITSYTSLLRAAGLKVQSVDLSALALYRLYHYLNGQVPSDFMVASISANRADLYLFHNGVPDFNRSIALDDMLVELSDDATDRWKWRDIESELSRILDFYQFNIREGKSRISDLAIMGGVPDKEELVDYLRQIIANVNIVPVDYGKLISGATPFNLDEYDVALGMALKGAGYR
jgi:type IV pilus assembly protein PilN